MLALVAVLDGVFRCSCCPGDVSGVFVDDESRNLVSLAIAFGCVGTEVRVSVMF